MFSRPETLRLENRSTGYFLTAQEFEALTNHQEVELRASELLGILSGPSKLSFGSRTILKTSGVMRIDQSG